MVQICEKLKSFKCSWTEIHGIREDYVCGIDEAVRLLHQLKRNAVEHDKQDRWLRNQENGSVEDEKKELTNYPKTGVLVDVSNTWPSEDKFIGYSDNSVLNQSSTSDGSYKVNKNILSHSKLPSWSEGVTSQLTDYHCRNVISKSNETDSYASRSFDDHIQSNYSFLNKSINPVSRYPGSNIMPDSWGDSWDVIQSPLQPGPYHSRNDSFMNCDLDSHRTGYNQTVPNIKEPYSSQFGHMYPPHPIMPVGIPAFPYPLPHDFSIPPRQCQCRICCESQMSMMTNKYHHSKDSSSNFESSIRSMGRLDANQRENADVCVPFVKMSIENSNAKSRNFPVNAAVSYGSYQTAGESSNEIVLRPDAEKLQHNNSKRGSYYDNVPSTFENDVNTCVVAPSLNSKCDFQSNGVLPSTSLTLSKPRSQKGTSVTDSVGSSHSLKLPKKGYSNASFNSALEKTDTSGASNLDSKNIKSNQIIGMKDAKGSKKWSCSSCTFYNAADKSICDMCGRSKHPGPENTPLVSGGRECPQCTLVNKKDSENCTACGASLKDSPTYI